MSYKVRIDSFEGPFDLLLYLVSRQKVDIGAISITEIADLYLPGADEHFSSVTDQPYAARLQGHAPCQVAYGFAMCPFFQDLAYL